MLCLTVLGALVTVGVGVDMYLISSSGSNSFSSIVSTIAYCCSKFGLMFTNLGGAVGAVCNAPDMSSSKIKMFGQSLIPLFSIYYVSTGLLIGVKKKRQRCPLSCVWDVRLDDY